MSDKSTSPEALQPSGTVPAVEIPKSPLVPRELRDSELRGEFLLSVVDSAAEKAARRTADYFVEEGKLHRHKVESYLIEHRREALARLRADEQRELRFNLFCDEVREELGAIKRRLEEGNRRFEQNEGMARIDRERGRRVLESVQAIKLQQEESALELGPACVLLVEDDPEVRAAAARLLEKAGASVLTAETIDGARACLNPLPHVAVIDLALRGGEEGMRLVRELCLGHGSSIGVVIASGNVDAAVREEARELGVAAVLHKPFSSQVLLSAVAEANAARGQVQ